MCDFCGETLTTEATCPTCAEAEAALSDFFTEMIDFAAEGDGDF